MKWSTTPAEEAVKALEDLNRAWPPHSTNRPPYWIVAVTPSHDICDMRDIVVDDSVSRTAMVRVRAQVKLPYAGASVRQGTWRYDPAMYAELLDDIIVQRAKFEVP